MRSVALHTRCTPESSGVHAGTALPCVTLWKDWRARQDGRSLREAAVVALRAARRKPVTPAFGV